MATKTKTQTYNLNLSPKYVPNWGPWEIAREILCNALDVDEHKMRIVENGTDYLEIITTTIPDVSQLFVIGEGTKQVGGETIGQFGEGIKMAALAATRLKQDSFTGMTIYTPNQTIEFSFEVGVGQTKSLHAHSTESVNPNEFRVVINIPDVVKAVEGRILKNRKSGPIIKEESDEQTKGCKIFCKGIYITTVENDSIFDWNLNGITINRDRDMVANDTIWREIVNYFREHGNEAQFKVILESNGCLESSAIYYVSDSTCNSLLGAAFHKNYPNHVLSSNYEEADQLAKEKGYSIFETESYNIGHILRRYCGVKESTQVTGTCYKFESVDDVTPYQEEIAKLKKLASLIPTEPFSVRVFKKREDEITNNNDSEVDMVIWLCESLFQNEDKTDLVGYFAHNLVSFIKSEYLLSKQNMLTFALSNAVYQNL